MISLVLPYWERLAATDAALASLAARYPRLALEVVVVDDGSPAQPYRAPAGLPFRVKVLRLPEKDGPLNPCLPINAGVAAAEGDVIGISNPEMLHLAPVLPGLLEELARGGPDTYALAAAWHVEGKQWHAHGSIAPPVVEGIRLPEGSHFHFLGLLRRELWQRCGGFDPDYRDGAGYDDPDFVLRLARAGARFVLRDDLVVHHVREAARARWRPEQFERNRLLFRRKWAAT